jgi:hypothetical protein
MVGSGSDWRFNMFAHPSDMLPAIARTRSGVALLLFASETPMQRIGTLRAPQSKVQSCAELNPSLLGGPAASTAH